MGQSCMIFDETMVRPEAIVSLGWLAASVAGLVGALLVRRWVSRGWFGLITTALFASAILAVSGFQPMLGIYPTKTPPGLPQLP